MKTEVTSNTRPREGKGSRTKHTVNRLALILLAVTGWAFWGLTLLPGNAYCEGWEVGAEEGTSRVNILGTPITEPAPCLERDGLWCVGLMDGMVETIRPFASPPDGWGTETINLCLRGEIP